MALLSNLLKFILKYFEKVVPAQLSSFKPGMKTCPHCNGGGCRKCNRFGKMEELTRGVYTSYSRDFIRGYEDNQRNINYEDCPFMLKIRAREWQKGWESYNE